MNGEHKLNRLNLELFLGVLLKGSRPPLIVTSIIHFYLQNGKIFIKFIWSYI